MDPLAFDDFKKMQLLIGKIVSVELHPGADKLYVVQVDLGAETRQVVAGIRPFYTPEQLLGKCVVVVANLAPVNIRSVDSNGMILAAQDGGRVVILSPEVEVAPGSTVR